MEDYGHLISQMTEIVDAQITLADVMEIWHRQLGRCYISNLELSFEPNRYDSATIVEKVRDSGYTKDNTAIACPFVRDLTYNYPCPPSEIIDRIVGELAPLSKTGMKILEKWDRCGEITDEDRLFIKRIATILLVSCQNLKFEMFAQMLMVGDCEFELRSVEKPDVDRVWAIISGDFMDAEEVWRHSMIACNGYYMVVLSGYTPRLSFNRLGSSDLMDAAATIGIAGHHYGIAEDVANQIRQIISEVSE